MKPRSFLFLLVCAAIQITTPRAAPPAPLEGKKFIIDPGHGAIDSSGKIINSGRKANNGAREHKINLDIAAQLKDYLTRLGAEVYLTRTPDEYWRESLSSPEDNRARGYFANEYGADAFLAIHCDWHPKEKHHGVTTYYLKNNSRKLAALIQQSLVEALEAKNRGIGKDNFSVLEVVEMPAVLLEVGYLSNNQEGKKLQSPSYQQKIVKAISQALVVFFSD